MNLFEFTSLPIEGAYLIQQNPVKDNRGLFSKVFSDEHMNGPLPPFQIKQANHSVTTNIGSIRGLHYQIAPFTENKLVKCIKGKIFDVFVDCRKNSPTFLKWYGTYLTPESFQMLWVPTGCAHGFQAVEAHSEAIYFSNSPYKPASEMGLRYDDPKVKINWAVTPSLLSERDLSIPFLDSKFDGL